MLVSLNVWAKFWMRCSVQHFKYQYIHILKAMVDSVLFVIYDVEFLFEACCEFKSFIIKIDIYICIFQSLVSSIFYLHGVLMLEVIFDEVHHFAWHWKHIWLIWVQVSNHIWSSASWYVGIGQYNLVSSRNKLINDFTLIGKSFTDDKKR